MKTLTGIRKLKKGVVRLYLHGVHVEIPESHQLEKLQQSSPVKLWIIGICTRRLFKYLNFYTDNIIYIL